MTTNVLRVGFTGTRAGTTPAQYKALGAYLKETFRTFPGVELHNGLCLGADEQCVELAYGHCRIVGHPGDLPYMVSEKAKSQCDEVRDVFPNLVRNRHIVLETAVLLACPAGPEEVRSGTWATIRYCRTRPGKLIVYFRPDGTIESEST